MEFVGMRTVKLLDWVRPEKLDAQLPPHMPIESPHADSNKAPGCQRRRWEPSIWSYRACSRQACRQTASRQAGRQAAGSRQAGSRQAASKRPLVFA